MRIERILIPIDFSPASTAALNGAVSLARRFRANLTLLHVLESRNEDPDQVNLRLSSLLAPEDQDDLNVQTIAAHGNPQEAILSAVHEQNANLVVMGTHGRGFVSRLFVGSVALGVLRHIDVPVITVSHPSPTIAFGRIVFGTDLSDTSLAALQLVFDIAQSEKPRVTVLYAIEIGLLEESALPMGAYVTPDYREEARTRLDEFVAVAPEHSVPIESIFVEGSPAAAILKTAEDKAADLIVISTTHKSRLERALLGSTAERVVRESSIPVLSIPRRVKADVGGKRAA